MKSARIGARPWPSLALVPLLMAALGTQPLRGEIEFSGYIATADGSQFILVDPAAQKTSGWLGVGGSFAGYTVKSFDAKTETLTVEKAGAATRLTLKSATARPAPPTMVRVSPSAAVSSNFPAEKLADMEAREKAARELLLQRQKTLDRRADFAQAAKLKAQDEALRQRYPEDHPERIEVRRKLTELEPRLARARVEELRETRATALKQIQNPASTPAQVEEGKRLLEKAESALARESVAP